MRWIGILLCLLAWSCDRFGTQESSGKLGEVTLKFTGRRAVAVPESLRIRITIDGKTATDLSKPLFSFDTLDLDVPFGSRLAIQAYLYAAGDTLETGDTTFVMPSVSVLRLVLSLRSTPASGLAWETPPRSLAHVDRSFSDTLRISGAGLDSAILSLVEPPSGMALSGNKLEWTPTGTGVVPVKLSVARWSRIDTLEWSIGVIAAPIWKTTPRSTASAKNAFSDTLRLSGAGLDSATLSLVRGGPGMTLTGNRLDWLPTDTGTFPVKLAVSRWSWMDTLEWSIVVVAGPVWETPPRSSAYVSRAFFDTLRISGAGMDSAILSLVRPPAGLILSGNALSWTPTDTGMFPLKVSVVRGNWIDSLSWSITVRDSVELFRGMVRIPAAGKSFVFGSGIGLDSGIVPTLVALSQDFDMDPTEVTRTKFDSVMLAKYPSNYLASTWGGAVTGSPISNINFAGVALYCNALSQAANLDTVFQYDRLTWVNWIPTVQNLRMRPNVRGYRPPTEAEWEFAARGGSDSLHPWPAGAESGYANYTPLGTFGGGGVDPVASLKPNGYGLYDMFGNVAEMVLGVYVNGWSVPETQDPWGPGIWNWGGSWRIPLRGGSANSRLERTSLGQAEYTSNAGFRAVLPLAAQAQGSIQPGLVPSSQPTSDSVFTVTAGTRLDIPFTLWDLFGESLSLAVSGGGPTVVGNSIRWTPTRADIGLQRFEVTAVADVTGRTSRPFPLKIRVK